jgi:hypothetical protein
MLSQFQDDSYSGMGGHRNPNIPKGGKVMVGVSEESKSEHAPSTDHIPGENAFGGPGKKRKTNESLWEGSKYGQPDLN